MQGCPAAGRVAAVAFTLQLQDPLNGPRTFIAMAQKLTNTNINMLLHIISNVPLDLPTAAAHQTVCQKSQYEQVFRRLLFLYFLLLIYLEQTPSNSNANGRTN